MKKIALILLGALLASLYVSTPSHPAAVPDEQWVQPSHPEDGFQGFLLQDARTDSGYSRLVGSQGSSTFVCRGVNIGDCQNASSYGFNAVLPACLTQLDNDCIESLVAFSPNGGRFNGTFKQYVWFKHPNQYRPDPASGLPVGGAPSLWSISGAKHSQGEEYLITASIGGGGNASKMTVSDFNLNLFAASIHVKTTPATFDTNPANLAWMDFTNQRTDSDGITRTFGQGVGEYDSVKCASYLQDPMQCVVGNPFPTGFSYEIKLRLSSEPNGWFHGRMNNPSVVIEHAYNGSVLMTVKANPIKTPIVYYGGQFSILPSNLQELYRGCGAWPTCDFRSSRQEGQDGVGKKADPLTRNMMSVPQPWGVNAIKELEVWLPVINNTATASPEVWSIHTVGNDQLSSSNGCFTKGKGLLGIVSTNASAYSKGPPFFTDGQLTYQVAAPHYLNDGTAFKGTYDLIMRSDVARCLYGFSTAPIKASIQVIGDSGSQNIATTSFTEIDGWDRLSAKNFEFSSPSIKVKLEQNTVTPAPEPVVSAPTPIASPIAKEIPKISKPLKLYSITCIKGQTIKKITSHSSSCPKGYVKK